MVKKILLGVLALLVIGGAGFVLWIGPRNVIGVLTYGRQARDGKLAVGDAAPRVALYDVDGSTARDLGEWIGDRPLVLVFGSFT